MSKSNIDKLTIENVLIAEQNYSENLAFLSRNSALLPLPLKEIEQLTKDKALSALRGRPNFAINEAHLTGRKNNLDRLNKEVCDPIKTALLKSVAYLKQTKLFSVPEMETIISQENFDKIESGNLSVKELLGLSSQVSDAVKAKFLGYARTIVSQGEALEINQPECIIPPVLEEHVEALINAEQKLLHRKLEEVHQLLPTDWTSVARTSVLDYFALMQSKINQCSDFGQLNNLSQLFERELPMVKDIILRNEPGLLDVQVQFLSQYKIVPSFDVDDEEDENALNADEVVTNTHKNSDETVLSTDSSSQEDMPDVTIVVERQKSHNLKEERLQEIVRNQSRVEYAKRALDQYIADVEGVKKGDKVDYQHGFWVLKQQQGLSRLLNCQLAKELKKQLEDGQSVEDVFEKNLVATRQQVIETDPQFRPVLENNYTKSKWQDYGIRGRLAEIINKVHSGVTSDEAPKEQRSLYSRVFGSSNK